MQRFAQNMLKICTKYTHKMHYIQGFLLKLCNFHVYSRYLYIANFAQFSVTCVYWGSQIKYAFRYNHTRFDVHRNYGKQTKVPGWVH